MVTSSFRYDAAAGIEAIFGDMATLSCLTGSALESTPNSSDSDVDIVVVLRDDAELQEALTARTEFTSFYVRLHHEHGYVPDLEWPGEVLYQRELEDALQGAAFDANPRSTTAPALCTEDQPYRYWVSMVATGCPLTGAEIFEGYAESCAKLVAVHSAAALTDDNSDPLNYWEENWHIPVPNDADRTWRVLRQTRHPGTTLTASVLVLCAPVLSPQLERYAGTWSQVAHKTARVQSIEQRRRGSFSTPHEPSLPSSAAVTTSTGRNLWCPVWNEDLADAEE